MDINARLEGGRAIDHVCQGGDARALKALLDVPNIQINCILPEAPGNSRASVPGLWLYLMALSKDPPIIIAASRGATEMVRRLWMDPRLKLHEDYQGESEWRKKLVIALGMGDILHEFPVAMQFYPPKEGDGCSYVDSIRDPLEAGACAIPLHQAAVRKGSSHLLTSFLISKPSLQLTAEEAADCLGKVVGDKRLLPKLLAHPQIH